MNGGEESIGVVTRATEQATNLGPARQDISMKPIIISIKPRWAELIRSGRKTIELRRRFPRLPPGSGAYLYESSPVCGLTALLRIGTIYELPTMELWRLYGTVSCIGEREFFDYFVGRSIGYGIQITACTLFSETVSLPTLRSEFAFTAPQSWAYASQALISGVVLPV